MNSVKKETIKAAKWSFIQKLTVQPVQLVFGMVLARLITPEEMGVLGLTAIFFAVAGTLADSGFGAAIIRKQDRTDNDLNTVFWFNLAMSAVMSGILFMLAPWFADFYGYHELIWLTRVSAIMMFVSSLASVHNALFQSRRDFKTLSIIGMISTFTGMPICLVLAWLGWGVWALMVQNVVSSLISLGLIWHLSPWKPRMMFSRASFKELFGFGCKLAMASLLHTLYAEARTFIIGKFYSAGDLGLYNRGNSLAALLPTTIIGILSSITYPILSSIQDDDARLEHVYRQYIKVSSVAIAWFSMILIALAEPAVYITYGETWVPCAVFIQILCFVYAFDHICGININLLKVKGKSGAILRLEIIKKSISMAILIYAATISVEAMCWGMVVYTQIAVFINCYYTKSLIGLGWWQQQKDYMSYYLLAALCSCPAFALTYTGLHAFWQVFIGGFSSLLIYVGVLYFCKESAFMELYTLVKNKVKHSS